MSAPKLRPPKNETLEESLERAARAFAALREKLEARGVIPATERKP